MKLSNPLRVRVRYLGPTAPSEIRPPAAASYPTRLSDPGRRLVVLLAECFGDCSVTNNSGRGFSPESNCPSEVVRSIDDR